MYNFLKIIRNFNLSYNPINTHKFSSNPGSPKLLNNKNSSKNNNNKKKNK